MADYQDSHFCEELRESNLYILTEFFKVLGDPTRIRILFLLMEQDSCVSNLAKRLGMTQSAVSHQLNILKSNKLVKWRRDGKMIFYTLEDESKLKKLVDEIDSIQAKKGEKKKRNIL